MIAFFMTLWRFLLSIARGLRDREFRAIFVVVIALLASGTVFYSEVENWGVIDSLYFSVITLTTVGYGDMHPTTPLSKLFTVFYILVGIGVLMLFIEKLATNAVKRREGERPPADGSAGGRWSGRRRKESGASKQEKSGETAR